MNFRTLALIGSFLAAMPAFAQPVIGHFVSFGVTGGVGLTDAFASQSFMGVDTDSRDFSGSKDYIVGPSIEVHLPLSFSVEVDALYRPLHLTTTNTIISGGGSTFTSSSTRNSWEFPLLAKYRLPGHLIRPFIEAGPSFRTTQSFPSDSPHLSRAGFAAGVGVEGKFGPIRIAPGIRYTRWGSDSNGSLSSFSPQSNVNQTEFLVGLKF